MTKLDPGTAACPPPVLRIPARRNRIATAHRRLLATLAVLVVPVVAVAQDIPPTDTLDDLRAKVDALMMRDDLTPEQATALEEMRAGLDVQSPEDLDIGSASVLMTITSGLRESKDDPMWQAVQNIMASFVGLLVHRGELTRDEVDELEAKLVLEPNDIAARTKLIGHYSGNLQERARRAHGRHVVWLIENAPYVEELGTRGPSGIDPRMSELYLAGRNAWRSHVEREPENPVFIARYARFVGWRDRSLHIELLARASRLDAQNADLAWELGHALLLASKSAEENDRAVRTAEEALEHFDRAYGLADHDIARNGMLGGRAQAAFGAGRYDLAQQHAQAMLDAEPILGPDGDLLHEGNTMLRRIALVEGDVARAKSHLLASGNVPSSPVLGSFGPSMSLASELLALGHREVVLDYFDLCAVFWNRAELRAWRAAINAGMAPHFGYHASR